MKTKISDKGRIRQLESLLGYSKQRITELELKVAVRDAELKGLTRSGSIEDLLHGVAGITDNIAHLTMYLINGKKDGSI